MPNLFLFHSFTTFNAHMLKSKRSSSAHLSHTSVNLSHYYLPDHTRDFDLSEK